MTIDPTCADCGATDLWFNQNHDVKIAAIGKWRSRSGKKCVGTFNNWHRPKDEVENRRVWLERWATTQSDVEHQARTVLKTFLEGNPDAK